ncbi:hypothetical protein Q7689_26140, partial [Nocardiopsis tropica]|nr:hypothetical protein [Nocardiopsis tropica]
MQVDVDSDAVAVRDVEDQVELAVGVPVEALRVDAADQVGEPRPDGLLQKAVGPGRAPDTVLREGDGLDVQGVRQVTAWAMSRSARTPTGVGEVRKSSASWAPNPAMPCAGLRECQGSPQVVLSGWMWASTRVGRAISPPQSTTAVSPSASAATFPSTTTRSTGSPPRGRRSRKTVVRGCSSMVGLSTRVPVRAPGTDRPRTRGECYASDRAAPQVGPDAGLRLARAVRADGLLRRRRMRFTGGGPADHGTGRASFPTAA